MVKWSEPPSTKKTEEVVTEYLRGQARRNLVKTPSNLSYHVVFERCTYTTHGCLLQYLLDRSESSRRLPFLIMSIHGRRTTISRQKRCLSIKAGKVSSFLFAVVRRCQSKNNFRHRTDAQPCHFTPLYAIPYLPSGSTAS